MSKVFGLVRFVAVFGVFSSLLLAAGLYLMSAIRSIGLVLRTARDPLGEETVERLVLASIQQADALLVATALLIVGIGLYSLFIGNIGSLPKWLEIRSFDSLKETLIGLIVAALAVLFFSIAMEARDARQVLYLGLGIAAVILALAIYSAAHSFAHRSLKEPSPTPGDPYASPEPSTVAP